MPKIDFESCSLEYEKIDVKGNKIELVTLSGRISHDNAFNITKRINVIFEDGTYNVILNLSKLEYMTSVGIAMLLTLIKTVDQHGGKLVIGGLNHFIENVIKLMELPQKAQIFNSVEEAKSVWRD